MTTHFKCASNCKCIDRHRDLFLFCPFFLVFSIFLLLHFSFCITAGIGVLNVTLLPMQPVVLWLRTAAAQQRASRKSQSQSHWSL